MKIKKIVPIILCLSMLMGNIVPVFASEATGTIEKTETTETSENKNSRTTLNYTKGETFSIKIPKTVVINNRITEMDIEVKGDIASNSYIKVKYPTATKISNGREDYFIKINYDCIYDYKAFFWGDKLLGNGQPSTYNIQKDKESLKSGVTETLYIYLMKDDFSAPMDDNDFSQISAGQYEGNVTFIISLETKDTSGSLNS